MKIPVTIARITPETPSVKSFNLDLQEQEFIFKSGQWIDCYAEIEGKTQIAGYSMTSSPLTKGSIEIAVKLVGDNRVTTWLHEHAKVGDALIIEGGSGDFFYEKGMADSLVLIGGGIGITPLMSIVRCVDEACPDVQLALVYSAQTPSELIFRDNLESITSRNPNIRCVFTVTQNSEESWKGHRGRINAQLLEQEGIDLAALFYVCGPPQMIQETVAMLETLGVSASRIRYEQWW